MRRSIAFGLLAVLAFSLLHITLSTEAADPAAKDPDMGRQRHIVLFKFKDGTAAADVKKIEDGFRALPSKIPTIVDYEWGTNNSPEGLADGFTHCFQVTFKDAKGRAVYLPHPAHKAFVKVLGPHLDKVLVIDYVAKE